jgi:hypothetical protein
MLFHMRRQYFELPSYLRRACFYCCIQPYLFFLLVVGYVWKLNGRIELLFLLFLIIKLIQLSDVKRTFSSLWVQWSTFCVSFVQAMPGSDLVDG